MGQEDPLTSTVRPVTDSVITVRIIKSFPYRNVKNYVLRSINLRDTTPQKLLEDMRNTINTTGALRPYRGVGYNALKIYSQAHGTKSMNLVVNLDHDDDWLLVNESRSNKVNGSTASLHDLGVLNETEISMFVWEDYVSYKQNPENKW